MFFDKSIILSVLGDTETRGKPFLQTSEELIVKEGRCQKCVSQGKPIGGPIWFIFLCVDIIMTIQSKEDSETSGPQQHGKFCLHPRWAVPDFFHLPLQIYFLTLIHPALCSRSPI